MLIDVRFVVSRCVEALQICTSADASNPSRSHVSVREEPPAEPDRDGAVLVCKRCASHSSFETCISSCCATHTACRSARRRRSQAQLEGSCTVKWLVLLEASALVQIWSASTHRLTTNRASISISVARPGRGT